MPMTAAVVARRATVVVGMGGKWQTDTGVLQGVAEMVKGFKQKQHEQTETVDRYLQVRGVGRCGCFLYLFGVVVVGIDFFYQNHQINRNRLRPPTHV